MEKILKNKVQNSMVAFFVNQGQRLWPGQKFIGLNFRCHFYYPTLDQKLDSESGIGFLIRCIFDSAITFGLDLQKRPPWNFELCFLGFPPFLPQFPKISSPFLVTAPLSYQNFGRGVAGKVCVFWKHFYLFLAKRIPNIYVSVSSQHFGVCSNKTWQTNICRQEQCRYILYQMLNMSFSPDVLASPQL